MAQLYSTGGVYYGTEDDIVEFANRIRDNDYHFESRTNLKFGDDIGNSNYYIFFGEILETNEGFYFCIYDIMESGNLSCKNRFVTQRTEKNE